jgi:hypothetical protein
MKLTAFFFLFLLFLFPAAILATALGTSETASVTEHVVGDGTKFYSLTILVPEGVTTVAQAWLEFRADVSAKDLNGFVDPAPVLDVFALESAMTSDAVPSKFAPTALPMSRPVAVGDDRLVRVDITEFVRRILAEPTKNQGIVLGPLTNDKRGIFAIKANGLGPGVTARVRVVE